jgi:hypothetical protein
MGLDCQWACSAMSSEHLQLHSRQDVALASLLLSVTDAEWYSPPAKAKTS